MPYKHTQIGYLMLFTLLAIVVLFGSILTQAELEPTIIWLMLFVLLLIASFSTLTVSIDSSHLRLKFGYGIFRKRFELSKIESVKAVRNHWYFGWGIRFWFWPRMVIFNVSGFDAVEIVMKNGKIYRIGTDESVNLEQAIRQAISD
jgi:hypothetical protein